MLALQGIFILVTQHGLEYPAFYRRLYTLLNQDAFAAKHRSQVSHCATVACLAAACVREGCSPQAGPLLRGQWITSRRRWDSRAGCGGCRAGASK